MTAVWIIVAQVLSLAVLWPVLVMGKRGDE
jgi:hypothetical protein